MTKKLLKNAVESLKIEQKDRLDSLQQLCTVQHCNKRFFTNTEKALYNKNIDLLLAQLQLIKGS